MNCEFIRKTTAKESRNPAHYLCNIPDKQGHEKVYRPYGNTGDRAHRGYYYIKQEGK